jgi:hypothetical protein
MAKSSCNIEMVKIGKVKPFTEGATVADLKKAIHGMRDEAVLVVAGLKGWDTFKVVTEMGPVGKMLLVIVPKVPKSLRA